ncbi:MAG: class I adenylate-forming enzyme family protein [Sphingobium sp.]
MDTAAPFIAEERDRPWDRLIDEDWRIEAAYTDLLAIFDAAVARNPEGAAIHYFDAVISYRDLDTQSDRLAAHLVRTGFRPGDRLAVFMQNIPAFPIAMLATWKAGGVFLPVNPMNRARELAHILEDARPHCLILEPGLVHDVLEQLPAGGWRPAAVLVASGLDHSDGGRASVVAREERPCDEPSLMSVTASAAPIDFMRRALCPAAFLMYTSGTTGAPKGALISHHAASRSAVHARFAYGLEDGDAVIALAPIFHTTGLMCTVLTAFDLAGSLILHYKFAADVALEAIARHRPAFTAAAPTAFMALTKGMAPGSDRFASFRACGIGGAANSPTLVRSLNLDYGLPAQTGYGMTETSGAACVAPLKLRDDTPIDPDTGALSVGVPLPGVDVWIADEQGRSLPVGQIGEIIVQGRILMDGYWERADATEEALRPDGLQTGDVGFFDEAGWLYLVDRKKDMIVASGFKVWPREVEDVLSAHPAVEESAVIGVPDPYRGETVKAYVVLRSPGAASVEALLEHCGVNLAAYKRPREMEIVDELPKTASGKVQRAALR